MDTMTVFSNNEFNTSLASLDPDKVYCAVANLHSSLGFGFSYRWIDCDNGNTNTASRLCFKEPVACLTPASPPASSTVSPPASAMTTTTMSCSSCEPPWLEGKQTKSILGITDVPCYAIFGQTTGWDDQCYWAGGNTIYFTPENQGSEGLLLQTLLSQGTVIPQLIILFDMGAR